MCTGPVPYTAADPAPVLTLGNPTDTRGTAETAFALAPTPDELTARFQSLGQSAFPESDAAQESNSETGREHMDYFIQTQDDVPGAEHLD